MTLKELINRCDFKDIASIIVKSYPETPWALVRFKEAFDILRHLEPEANPTNREIRLVGEYDESSQTYYPHITRWGELLDWKEELSSEIIVEDELMLTDAEIAYHCLWELTYYGFDQSTPEKVEEVFLNMMGFGEKTDSSNPYAMAAEKLEDKLRANTKIIFEKGYGLVERPTTNRNRAKRKRDYRMRQRIKKLKRKARVEDDIRRLTTNTKSFKREELDYLFKTNLITFRTYHSHSNNPNQRIDYLTDLLSKWVSDDFSDNTHFLLMFRTSSAYPLVQSELDMIQNFFSQYFPASASIRYGYGNDENLGTEVSLYFLCSY